jgi:hypothetical protein
MKFHLPPMRPDFRPIEGLCYALKEEAEHWWNMGVDHRTLKQEKAAQICFQRAKEAAAKADAEANRQK